MSDPLTEAYREALQDCYELTHAAIRARAWDRFKAARAVYQITREVLDEEPDKKLCPECGKPTQDKESGE